MYYSRAVNYTILYALNDLATRVNNCTQQTAKAIQHYLNYCKTNQEATVLSWVSDMILDNYSDEPYLVVTEVRSRVGGKFIFGNKDEKTQINNSPISTIEKGIKHVKA